MKTALISDEIVERVRALLDSYFPGKDELIGLELQDDFQFLLISIECSSDVSFSEDDRRKIGLLVDQLMPTRCGELTWMLNFTTMGRVKDSYFGGDLNSPGIGF